ncbi:hypothetical protein SKAU_G00207990 [Synaphobranchus kaupii]|uniref:CCHC-type domain-containing protein n=1 Tax=Synaphobranchus kaupii TaxID=118154 RepID=A0A9Q1F8H5_SYNKA|nr:hypothetical protein SKAU_G00207990 [Synaphobranchus kaupii]
MSSDGQEVMEQSVVEMALPTRRKFRQLTKDQLVRLAAEQEVEVPEGILKPALAKLIMATLDLEEWWADDERERAVAEREGVLRAEREERESRERLAQFEVERTRAAKGIATLEPRFDVRSAISLMPKFSEEDIDTFFDAFEVVARECDWPEAKWPLLVQSVLKGKAQVAFAALDPRMGLEYESLKMAVLTAYGGVPEAYRQRFRTVKRRDGESYLDLSRKLGVACERWLKSTETYDFAQLKELVLLEQLKNSVPRAVEIYLSEQKVSTLLEAAQAADAYEVIHGRSVGLARLAGGSHDHSRGRETSGKGLPLGGKASGAQRPGMEKSHSAVVCHHCREPGHIKPRCPRLKRERDRDIICHGCRWPGHVQSQCPQRSQLESRAKVVALVASLTKRDEGIGCSGPREGPSVSYQPFTSVGTVSVASGGEEVSITILRDTGAAQSLLLEGVIELPRDGFSRSALIKGLGGQYDCVPLYTVHLKSNVVKGPVTVGVVPTLPVPGVSLLLGNDLAGSQVCVTPVVVSTPLEVPETQELEREHPEVFTACVVTRALARKAETQASEALTPISEEVPCVSATSGEKEHISLAGTVFAKAVSEEGTSAVKGPGFSPSPVADATHFSREVLIQEQNQDPSLAPLWKRAVTVEETWKVAAQNLTGAKERMKGQYDRKAVQRSFVPGDKVLVLTPVGRERFGTRFSGPYMVVRKVGACNYVISTPERRQKTRLCHINLLKLYVERDTANPVGCIVVVPSDREREEGFLAPEPVGARLDNSRACEQLQEQLKHLLKAQAQDVMALVAAHPSLFRDRPGLTSLVEHDVDTGGVMPMKQHPYRLPPFKKEKVREEVEYMLEIGAIEPGSGEWSSPVVLIPKSDGDKLPSVQMEFNLAAI